MAAMRLSLLLAVSAMAEADQWSFKTFFAGDWVLERTDTGVTTRAHYSMQPMADGSGLEGTRYEEGLTPDERRDEKAVRVRFVDGLETRGIFEFAQAQSAAVDQEDADWEKEDSDPVPAPAPELKELEFRVAFEFDFQELVGGRFHIALAPAGRARVQIVTVDENAFIITQFNAQATEGAVPTTTATTWTASRKGVTAAQPKKTRAPSLFEKWRRSIITLIVLIGAWKYKFG